MPIDQPQDDLAKRLTTPGWQRTTAAGASETGTLADMAKNAHADRDGSSRHDQGNRDRRGAGTDPAATAVALSGAAGLGDPSDGRRHDLYCPSGIGMICQAYQSSKTASTMMLNQRMRMKISAA